MAGQASRTSGRWLSASARMSGRAIRYGLSRSRPLFVRSRWRRQQTPLNKVRQQGIGPRRFLDGAGQGFHVKGLLDQPLPKDIDIIKHDLRIEFRMELG